jgi:hypothetical protein
LLPVRVPPFSEVPSLVKHCAPFTGALIASAFGEAKAAATTPAMRRSTVTAIPRRTWTEPMNECGLAVVLPDR